MKVLDVLGAGAADAQHCEHAGRYLQREPGRASSGLGLSICESIVQALEGNIAVTSQVGQGTTFTVTQNGNSLEAKNEKNAVGTGTVTSPISVSMGPPWNMLGVVSADGRSIEWSNGTQWRKQ